MKRSEGVCEARKRREPGAGRTVVSVHAVAVVLVCSAGVVGAGDVLGGLRAGGGEAVLWACVRGGRVGGRRGGGGRTGRPSSPAIFAGTSSPRGE